MESLGVSYCKNLEISFCLGKVEEREPRRVSRQKNKRSGNYLLRITVGAIFFL